MKLKTQAVNFEIAERLEKYIEKKTRRSMIGGGNFPRISKELFT